MFAAGRLDRRITLQTVVNSRDSIGGPVETWSDLATVWAQVRNVSAREVGLADQRGAAVKAAVTIRYRSDVADAMRVKFDDNSTATVLWIDEIGRREGLILYVEGIQS